MKYMMLVCVDATSFAEDEAAGCPETAGEVWRTAVTAAAFRGSTT